MNISEITLFNTLKSKLGEYEAQVVVEGIKSAVMEEFNYKKDTLATKNDIHLHPQTKGLQSLRELPKI